MPAMTRIRIATLTVAGAVAVAFVVAAAPVQVALVEDVTGNPAGVEFMDYLETGKIIELGPHDSIVLSYMSSCVQETITGGTVTIGTDQSEVQSGSVKRTRVQCDAGKMLLGGEQASPLAGSVLRGGPRVGESASASDAQLILYGSSPMLELQAPGALLIERIDQASERTFVDVGNEHLLHGRFYDFAEWGKALTAGGVYRATFGAQKIVFKIDPHAKPGHTPIVSRLLRFVLPS
jgi:hypothetical protein